MTKMHGTVVNSAGETFAYYCGRQAGAEWRDTVWPHVPSVDVRKVAKARASDSGDWTEADDLLDYAAGFMAAVRA